MSPRTSGAPDTPGDLDLPSVLTSRVCPAPARHRRHPLITAESLQSDVRRYFYRGRHRRPRPVYRTLQATTALLMFTGVSATLVHGQTAAQDTRPQAAVQLAIGQPAPGGLRTEDLAPPKTTTSAPPTTTSSPKSTDQTTDKAPDKPAEKPAEKTTTSKPTRLPVSQAAAQPTDQMGTWLNEALGILKANGYSESQMNASQIRAIIEHESAGNPDAINLWDSNAAKGTPSKGLMQTIDPTFTSWSLPGHRSIYNPVDNIIAGVRYAIGTYGSISNVPGVVSMASGGGYRGY